MKDIWILGINGLGNIPSACLLKNGEIIAMAEEERFTREKVSFGSFPIKSIQFCIQEANITLQDIKEISFAWDCNYYLFKMPFFLIVHSLKNIGKYSLKGGKNNIKRSLRELYWYNPFRVRGEIKRLLKNQFHTSKIPPIVFVNHHLSHALSTFYSSGFESSSIIVFDGCGESIATSIWYSNNNKLCLFKKWHIPNSIGWYYSMITEFLGYKSNRHEGKVMALAAYGEYDEKEMELFSRILSSPNGEYLFDSIYSISGLREKDSFFSDQLIQLLGKPRSFDEKVEKRHQNIAYHAQFTLENTALNIIQSIQKEKWFNGYICIAGGVGLNCKMNGMIALSKGVKKVFVPPFSSDSGTAYGAAVNSHFKYSSIIPKSLDHAYWGPCFTDQQILDALKSSSVEYSKVDNIEELTAQLLNKNYIIGWFQGKMEIGPRALGNRSIIANPYYYENKDRLNKEIKNRELWRPFAASVLNEKRMEYFDQEIDSPYMTIAIKAKDSVRDKIKAAIHIDGTTRPQFVKKEQNEKYWKLISEFGKLSGIYALLNTSFNLKEEPIVCTPREALNTFLNSSIDYLVIENYLIKKK